MPPENDDSREATRLSSASCPDEDTAFESDSAPDDHVIPLRRDIVARLAGEVAATGDAALIVEFMLDVFDCLALRMVAIADEKADEIRERDWAIELQARSLGSLQDENDRLVVERDRLAKERDGFRDSCERLYQAIKEESARLRTERDEARAAARALRHR